MAEDTETNEDANPYAHVDTEDQFWDELGIIVDVTGQDHEQIDDALRAILDLTASCAARFLQTESEYARCCEKLLHNPSFAENRDYILRQLLECLLADDDPNTLHLSAMMLLSEGRADFAIFETIQKLGAFPRLIELIKSAVDDDKGLHRILLELLFEMSRVQRLQRDDLTVVDDAFVETLFELIEQISHDVDHPYHSPVMGVLLVLNEQYMCLANEPTDSTEPTPSLTNRVLKTLSLRTHAYRTFGQNLVLVLNREMDLSPQLLILKLLFLLFTTSSTYEYFYTNDLYVIVDVFIRNLLNLEPEDSLSRDEDSDGEESKRDGQRALVHTYLRVLCPLLKNTQMAREGSNYKRAQIRQLLDTLAHRSSAHFAPVEKTVIRLVLRCKQIEWLREGANEEDLAFDQKLAELVAAPTSADIAKRMLGISLDDGVESTLSVTEVAAKVTQETMELPPSPQELSVPSSIVKDAQRARPSAPPPRRRTKLTVGQVDAGVGPQQVQITVTEGTEAHGNGLLASSEKPLPKTPDESGTPDASYDASPFADANAEL